MLSLINDILDYSKIDAGKLDLEVLPFDLRTLLADFTESLAFQAKEKNISLTLDISGIDQRMVSGDPGRVRQILTNLVSNAIKFTSHGEVSIQETLVEQQDEYSFLIIDERESAGIKK